MPADRFVTQLQEQIGHEFVASQQYVAIAVYYDGLTLPRLAAFFYAQSLEERNHAMMMVRYLLDAGEPVAIPAAAEPENAFQDIVAPTRLALEQERRVSEQIAALTGIARAEGDFQSEQFMQWFLKEQTEEVATMSDLLNVLERTRDNFMLAEDWLAREYSAGGAEQGRDASAPPVAGGAV
jgi:ferritin